MLRRLAELDRLDRGSVRRRAPGGERVRSVVSVLGVLAVLLAAWQVNGSPGSGPATLGRGPARMPASGLPAAGPVGAGLERPEEVRTDDGTYRFALVRSRDGAPVAYASCRPVPLLVNPDGAPAGAEDLVEQAIQEIRDASGLDLQVVGETDQRPDEARPPASGQVGTDAPPSLLAWSDPEETPRLSGSVAGIGGSALAQRGSDVAYTSGSVTLDGPQLAQTIETGEADVPRSIVVHELAHLVGLAHVSDPDELMYPQARASVTELQHGDLQGLAALGGGDCPDW